MDYYRYPPYQYHPHSPWASPPWQPLTAFQRSPAPLYYRYPLLQGGWVAPVILPYAPQQTQSFLHLTSEGDPFDIDIDHPGNHSESHKDTIDLADATRNQSPEACGNRDTEHRQRDVEPPSVDNPCPRPKYWRSEYPGRLEHCPLRRLFQPWGGGKTRLNPLLRFGHKRNFTIYCDLRLPPSSSPTLSLHQASTEINRHQLATWPPSSTLRLWHRQLPWYIDISTSHPNGITLSGFFDQLYLQLSTSISPREYFTTALGSRDRELLNYTFTQRCGGDLSMISRGVCRVDFLEENTLFVGLARSTNGTWEIKTRPPLH